LDSTLIFSFACSLGLGMSVSSHTLLNSLF
jgi:hypothetical protein